MSYLPVQTFIPGAFDLGPTVIAVVYVALAMSTPFAPRLVKRFGGHACLAFASCTYTLFAAATLTRSDAAVAVAAGVLGFGGGVLWTAQGPVLSDLSTDATRGKNSGFFLGCMRLSFVGTFAAQWVLDAGETVWTLFLILTIVCGVGTGVLCVLWATHVLSPHSHAPTPSPASRSAAPECSAPPPTAGVDTSSLPASESERSSAAMASRGSGPPGSSLAVVPSEASVPLTMATDAEAGAVAAKVGAGHGRSDGGADEPATGGPGLGIIKDRDMSFLCLVTASQGFHEGTLFGTLAQIMPVSQLGLLFGLMGAMTVVSNVLGGWLWDKLGRRTAAADGGGGGGVLALSHGQRRSVLLPLVLSLIAFSLSLAAVGTGDSDSTAAHALPVIDTWLWWPTAGMFGFATGLYESLSFSAFDALFKPRPHGAELVAAAHSARILTMGLCVASATAVSQGTLVPVHWRFVGAMALFCGAAALLATRWVPAMRRLSH